MSEGVETREWTCGNARVDEWKHTSGRVKTYEQTSGSVRVNEWKGTSEQVEIYIIYIYVYIQGVTCGGAHIARRLKTHFEDTCREAWAS